MALDSSKVDVAVTGTVSYAPVATAAPTDAVAALDPAYKDVGYISDDGVTETIDQSNTNITAWQGATVVRTVVTESSITVTCTMIETNDNSVSLYYADTVDTSDGSVEIDPSETGGRRRFVFDYVDGGKLSRLFLPQGEVTSRGDVQWASGNAVGYQVTVTGYPDATLGYSAKKWFSALDTTP